MADTIVKLNPNTWLQAESTGGDCSAGDPAILKVVSTAPSPGATSITKAEDSVAASGDVGVAPLVVRADTPAATGANGDYVNPLADSTGRLWVNPGIIQNEDAVHTSGDAGVQALAVRKDTAASVAADGDYHPLEVDASGRQWTHVGAIDAGETHVGEVGGALARATGNFTRPNDTTQYAVGDLVANNTTAGSVTPVSLTAGRGSSGSAATGAVRRVKIKKSNTSTTSASFRVHLFAASPTLTNGDNGAFLPTESTYLGAFDVTVDRAFSDAAVGVGVPVSGSEVAFTAQTIYALIEARATYTPAAQEVFTLTAEVYQN